MDRKTAGHFPPEVLKLFDGYIHGKLARRDFLDRAAKRAVGGFTAAAMLESLTPNYALAQQVPKDDKRIKSEYVTYPSPQGSGTMRGYFALPANAELDAKKRTADLLGAYAFLKSRPECTGKVGAVGFCFGGDMVNMLAVREPGLAAAVPFYGAQPNAEDTAKIKAPMLIHYAGVDERVDAGWPAFEAALKASGVKYQMYMYANANHGFHNDTTPRYDEAAAKLAWSRTIAFFNEHLRS